MAPLIDLVFLLIVFFMCVGTVSGPASRVPAKLAESRCARVPHELAHRLPVTVLAGGALYVGSAVVQAAELEERLREAVRGAPQLVVQVRAEAEVPFSGLRPVLEAAAQAGAGEVVFSVFEAP